MKGDARKSAIEKGKSPLCVLFEYGASAEGYWIYDWMVSLLEDVIDVLNALYLTPFDGVDSLHTVFVVNTVVPRLLVRKFDYLSLFDHSCGHDRKRADGLDVMGLCKGPTGRGVR